MIVKINNLLKKVRDIEDEEIASHLLNYVCVLISGYLETNIESIICDYKKTEHCNTHECKDNIKSQRKIQNAKWCAIRPIIMNIDENILSLLKDELDVFDDVVLSIDDIVKTRHKIAHGENVTNLTVEILDHHFENIQKFSIKEKMVTEASSLGKLYRSKKKEYIEQNVEHNEVEDYVSKGWEKVKELKMKWKIRKYKTHSKLFEDKVWCQFYDLGYRILNSQP